MAEKNNFKLLEEEQSKDYESSSEKVKSRINSDVASLNLIGQVMELYVSRFFDVIVNFTSIDRKDKK